MYVCSWIILHVLHLRTTSNHVNKLHAVSSSPKTAAQEEKALSIKTWWKHTTWNLLIIWQTDSKIIKQLPSSCGSAFILAPPSTWKYRRKFCSSHLERVPYRSDEGSYWKDRRAQPLYTILGDQKELDTQRDIGYNSKGTTDTLDKLVHLATSSTRVKLKERNPIENIYNRQNLLLHESNS